jgi:5-methylcytosine-specific restriction endonuclease McrA
VSGSTIRQEVLETALDWFSGGKIEGYMSAHQHDKDAQELWQYWQAVFDWVKRVFPNQDSARARLMKGLPWGEFYNKHKDDKLNAADLERRIVDLIDDDEVDSKRGIYEYLLTGNEKSLSLRAFDEKTKQRIYAKQKGICPVCNKHYDIDSMEADHIIPWSQGGKTTPDNCQMLCEMDNRTKSGK